MVLSFKCSVKSRIRAPFNDSIYFNSNHADLSVKVATPTWSMKISSASTRF